ncbi:MAG TPA: MFS transporter [Longimicrobiales bacterium]|nr:MFS transporter [Longimicrobiales bacterium]
MRAVVPPVAAELSVHVVAESPQPSSVRADAVRVAVLIAVAHGLTDAYASFVPPLLPRIMERLGLSITLAASLAVAFGIAGSLPQPFFGYLADRFGRRVFAVSGMLAAGVFVGSIGFAPTFGALILLLTLGGFGNAAFHPPGASYAVRVTEGRGGGRRYSLFAFGGAAGFAVGPLASVGIVRSLGMESLWVAMLPALVIAPLIARGLPGGRREDGSGPAPSPAFVLRQLRGPLGVMFGISATMTFIQRTFLTMEPFIVAEAGGSEARGAVALSVYLAAQSLGMVTGGLLGDRMNRRTLLVQLCAWALPAHVAALWLGPQGVLGLTATAAAGFLGLAALPPMVVMAQELLPSAAAVSSGIVMGLAWATGTLGVLGTGALADAIGPRAAALACMPMVLLAVTLALHPALARLSTAPGGPH